MSKLKRKLPAKTDKEVEPLVEKQIQDLPDELKIQEEVSSDEEAGNSESESEGERDELLFESDDGEDEEDLDEGSIESESDDDENSYVDSEVSGEEETGEEEDGNDAGENALAMMKVSDKPRPAKDAEEEYANDTSDEEDIRNTVGNIPMHWYDEYKHIGYDWDAKKIIQPEKGDQLDNFLNKMEDPDFWRTVKDPQTGQNVILSEEDIEIIKRISSQRIPNKDHNEFEVIFERLLFVDLLYLYLPYTLLILSAMDRMVYK